MANEEERDGQVDMRLYNGMDSRGVLFRNKTIL